MPRNRIAALMHATDAHARAVRTRYEQEVEGPITRGPAQVAAGNTGGDRMKKMIVASALLLAGCTHTSHVQDLDNGMHAVTASANWGGYTGSREETIAQANDFCGKSEQTAAIENFEDKPGVGSKGELTSTLTFRCTARPVLQLR